MRRWAWVLVAVSSWFMLAGPAVSTLSAQLRVNGPAAASVYVEDSPAAAELFEQVVRLASLDRHADAAVVAQQIIDAHGRKLARLDPHTYTDAAALITSRLAENPRLLEAYRQVHEPAAQRLLRQVPRAADGFGADPLALSRIAAQYPLCDAAMEAAMEAAGLWLERGQPDAAGHLLDKMRGHPALAQPHARWMALAAAAKALGGDTTQWAGDLQALDALDPAWARQLRSWTPGLTPSTPSTPSPQHAAHEADPEAAPQPGTWGPPLWETALPDAPGRRAGSDDLIFTAPDSIVAPGVTGIPGRGVGPTMPLLAGSQLIACTDETVTALDRWSGHIAWTHRLPEQAPQDAGMMVYGRGEASIPDARSVAVSGDRVFAVLGRSPGWPSNWRGRSVDSALTCLDQSDGRVVWTRSPSEVDAAWAAAYFHGSPILVHDQVIALVRRTQTSGFDDTFLVALNARDGATVWRRHISSIAAASRFTPRSSARAAAVGSALYVTDGPGVVARLDAADGGVRWLRVLTDVAVAPAEREPSLVTASARSAGPPVIVSAGLVIPSAAPTMPALLLDAATGRLLRTLTGPGWTDASYVLRVGDDLLSVGPTMRRIDGQTLQPRWTVTLTSISRESIGLPAVAAGEVWLTVGTQLQRRALDTGKSLGEHAVASPGHLLLRDGQAVLTGERSIRCHMTWDDARARLMQQTRQCPHDPAPAISLARLAAATGRQNVVIEAADLALASLDTAGGEVPRRSKVFSQLLAMAGDARTLDAPTRAALFDRVARITKGPDDEVAYQMAMAEFHVQSNRPQDAVDRYQLLLNDPTLSRQPHRHGGLTRQAGIEARLRLDELVRAAGPGVYARIASLAALRLAQLRADHAGPEALLAMAQQFPHAPAATEALAAAAQSLAASEKFAPAINAAEQALDRTDDPVLAGQLAGSITQWHVRSGQPRQARQWLLRFHRQRPQVQPMREGQALPVDAWLSELAAMPTTAGSLPRLTPKVGTPWTLPGRLLLPTAMPRNAWPRDRVLTLSDARLVLRQGPDLKPVWTAPVPGESFEVLEMTSEQVVLWSSAMGRMDVLNAANGTLAWSATTPPFETGDPAASPAPAAANRPAVEAEAPPAAPADRPPDRYVALLNNTVACLVDRRGRITSLDRATGRVLWRQQFATGELTAMALNARHLALATGGDAGPLEREQAVHLLDPRTGEARGSPMAPLEHGATVRWLAMDEDDRLIVGGSRTVATYAGADGRLLWRTEAPDDGGPTSGFVMGESLLLTRTGPGITSLLDIASGQVLSTLEGLGDQPGTGPPQAVEQTILLLSPDRAMAVDRRGRMLWRDAIAEAGSRRLMLLAGDTHLALLCWNGTDAVPGTPRYRLYLLDRWSGRLVGEHDLLAPAGQPVDPQRAALLDDRIILSGRESVIVIPTGP